MIWLDWSPQSSHIRTLFRPWQPGDGYEEEIIAAAEAEHGVRLPSALRSFYLAWGKRSDLTSMNEYLLAPTEWMVHSGALIICVENQGVYDWGIPLDAPGDAEPPVYRAESKYPRSNPQARLDWRKSHDDFSQFLDDLTYLHAFSGGACHGAHTAPIGRPEPWLVEHLDSQWRKASVTPLFQLTDPDATELLGSPLYVRDGQALHWFMSFWAVSSSYETLDEIASELRLTWQMRW